MKTLLLSPPFKKLQNEPNAVKRMLEAIDTEAEALGRVYIYKKRIPEREK